MKKSGFTLIELLVGIAVVGILSTALLAVLNPLEQIKKGRDAQRKQDLAQIQRPLEVYYNDKGKYPDEPFPFGREWKEEGVQYMVKVPQDPKFPTQEYKYKTEDGGYRLFAKLERCSDNQVIVGIDCNDPTITYNYSITSPNLSVPFGGGPTPTLSLPSGTPIPTVSTPTPTIVPVLCADGTNDQVYSSTMVGCNSSGTVFFAQAASLCASGSHLCSVEEYFVSGGRTISSSVQRTLSTRVSSFESCSSSFCGSSTCGLYKPGDSGNYLTTYQGFNAYTNSCSSIDASNVGYLIDIAIINPSNGAMCCSGAPIPTSTPTPTPGGSTKRVFVTSDPTYNGNLGGLSGADQKCLDKANAANLCGGTPCASGSWKAWLSDSTGSPSTRFSATVRSTTNPVVFKLIDGTTTIANGWGNLTTVNLLRPIYLAENGASIVTGNNAVFTDTGRNGYIDSSNRHCQNWTSPLSSDSHFFGNNTYTDLRWTEIRTSSSCSNQRRLYCFEQ